MDKIDHVLRQTCLSHLNKPIQILLIGLLTTEELSAMGLTPINGLDNLYKGKLTGRKILELEKVDAIKSIEIDADMNAL